MSKTTDALKAIGIDTMWKLTKKGHPVLKYHKAADGAFAYWHVAVKGGEVAKFWCGRGCDCTKADAKDEALRWIADTCPDVTMVPSPFDRRNGLVVVEDLEAALEAAGA